MQILKCVVRQQNKRAGVYAPCSRPGKYGRVLASTLKTESDYRVAAEESVIGD